MQFNDFAHHYNQNAFIQNDLIYWGAPFLDLIPLENKSILELGAGTGLLTQHLIKKNPTHLLATDISSQMLKEGQKQIPQAQWQLLNAWNASPSFDHFFSASLLQWAPNPQLVLQNWAKNIPQGGTIHALFFIDQTLNELRQLVPLKNFINWKTLSNWESLFKNAGLNIYLSRDLLKTYHFPSGLNLLKNLKTTGTSLKNHLCGSHLKKIIKDYDTKFNSKDGIFSSWHFCQIIASKSSI